MADAIQQIVDRIAHELRRPALVEDRSERLIAYSTHAEPMDEVRGYTIMHRRAAPQVIAWVNGRGIPAARSPMRVPGNPELGMLPRMCFPIRDHGNLLGYLWFVEPGEPMSAQDTARAAHAAAELRLALCHQNAHADPASDRVVAALRQLLLGGAERTSAGRQLHYDGYFQPTDNVVAVVIRPFCERPDASAVDRAVSCALRGVWQAVPPSKALQLRQPDHGVLLLPVPGTDPGALHARLSAIGDAVQSATDTLPGITRVIVGVGGSRRDLLDAADTYHEARLAARAGPCVGDIAHWTQLGIYQVVAQLVEDSDPPRVLHAGLRAVIGDPEALPLLETLETYLDVAGNAQVAARLLNLHRGSLYYRLQRIEQLADTSLRDGMQRLALHLELKVARLTGAYIPRQTTTRVANPPPTTNCRHPQLTRPT